VTGAGASRNLGIEEKKMPLMADWSDALCGALDSREQGFASACGLAPGMEGPEFEANLGLLLKFDQSRTLMDRFAPLGREDFRGERQYVTKARQLTGQRLEAFKRTLDATLYDEFGLGRVDDDRAADAFRALLEVCGREIVVATTNYDLSAEAALDALDFKVDAGFRATRGRTPALNPVGFVADRQDMTPVIHLHGAVGWYEKEGAVESHYADKPYNASLGTPVVLYPNPDKDPTNDAVVSQLWTEFNQAIEEAKAVVVIGHSLHDPSLVKTLKAAAGKKPVVISYFDKKDRERIENVVPHARALHLDFGPAVKVPHTLRKFIA
jgi:hypothetical protein